MQDTGIWVMLEGGGHDAICRGGLVAVLESEGLAPQDWVVASEPPLFEYGPGFADASLIFFEGGQGDPNLGIPGTVPGAQRVGCTCAVKISLDLLQETGHEMEFPSFREFGYSLLQQTTLRVDLTVCPLE